ncbi:MAG: cytoplasmic protein [Colwellia sp.]|nr:cytoplasmic protein [Colwellia sp.]
MEITFKKGSDRHGYLKCIRDDQTSTETKMPEQGIAPHDMIHFVVEKTLDIKGAFYGQLKAGANISFKLEHNELSRDIADKIDVWQTESMVESFQSLLWSGDMAFDSFNYLLQQTCENRNIPVPVVSEIQYRDLVLLLNQLNEQWKGVVIGQAITVKF